MGSIVNRTFAPEGIKPLATLGIAKRSSFPILPSSTTLFLLASIIFTSALGIDGHYGVCVELACTGIITKGVEPLPDQ
jgi:hypothetical protein